MNFFYLLYISAPDSAVVEFHKMTVSVVPNSECNATYNNLITDRMMCTGGANNETGICKVLRPFLIELCSQIKNLTPIN